MTREVWDMLAEWCVPAGTFPRWLTAGDGGWLVIPRLTDMEVEEIRARWEAAHRSKSGPMVL